MVGTAPAGGKKDGYPRVSLFPAVFDSDELDERFLRSIPAWRQTVYRSIPLLPAQVFLAFLLMRTCDAVISRDEKLAAPFASLLKLTVSRIPHVSLMCANSKRGKAAILKFCHSHIDRILLWTSTRTDFATEIMAATLSKIDQARYIVDQEFYHPLSVTQDMISSAGREM